jgi:spermidine synthase
MTTMSITDAMTVTVPEGSIGTLRVERFTIERDDFGNFLQGMKHGRSTRPGTYTALKDGGRIWMSDTDAEKRDHMEAIHQIRSWQAKRVLINGLGLGMVLAAALTFEHVEHVDVVEIDERVIELVGPHYAGPRVTIHHADAYEQAKKWPAGTRWDVAWHDIWPHLCTDNLPQMARLHRSYGRRVDWQGSWGKALCERQRAADSRSRWGWR